MSDKTGIEMLEELLQKVELLSKKVDILDQNIKKIANSAKLSELIDKAATANISGWSKPKAEAKAAVAPEEQPKGMRFKLEPVDASKVKQVQANRNTKSVPTNKPAMVKGKMITLTNNQPTPLPDITIKIFDGKNKLMKETKTNRAGQWMAQLSPGRYVVEMTGKYKGQDLVPQNKIFELPAGVDEFEVQ